MFFPYKDDNPRILFPFVTYFIIFINVLVFIYQYFILPTALFEEFIYRYALIPSNPSVLNIFSSMFMHGGLTHIIFNMWFLWIFGDNIESIFGHKKYLLFYFLWPNTLSILSPNIHKNHILKIILSLIHIWRCRRSTLCRSRWSPYH